MPNKATGRQRVLKGILNTNIRGAIFSQFKKYYFMKFRVTITLVGCTDLQGNPVVSQIDIDADSPEEAKKEGEKFFKLSLPINVEAELQEEKPCYE